MILELLQSLGRKELPAGMRADIVAHLAPEERKQLVKASMAIGAYAGFFPTVALAIGMMLVSLHPEWINWLTVGTGVGLTVAGEMWIYHRNKRRLAAFLLSTAWAKEKGCAEEMRRRQRGDVQAPARSDAT